MSDEPLFYDASETELDLPPPGYPLPVSIPFTPKVLFKHDQPLINCIPSLAGFLKTSLRRHLSTPLNILDFQLLYDVKGIQVTKSGTPVYHCQEDVACDIVYSDVSAIYGSTAAVIFVGVTTQVTDVMIVNLLTPWRTTLLNVVLPRNSSVAVVKLCASSKVADILCPFCIKNWQSEPHQQHQNPAERRYQMIKNSTNHIFDCIGVPAYTWLLCHQYVCFLLNHMYNSTLNGFPLTFLLGVTSVLLRFHFWKPVYFKLAESSFPSLKKELVCSWHI
jgi:hypothetical protein